MDVGTLSLTIIISASSQQRGGGPEGSSSLQWRRKHQPKFLWPHGRVYPGETEGQRNSSEYNTHTHTLIKESSSGVTKNELGAFSTRRAVVAAAQEVWKFPGICRSSSRQVRVRDPDPQMIIALLMIQGFPLNGLHLQVPAALMSLAQTASQTPLMPFNTPPASLIVSNNN